MLTLNGETSLSHLSAVTLLRLGQFSPEPFALQTPLYTKLTGTTVPIKQTDVFHCTFYGFSVIFKNVTTRISQIPLYLCVLESSSEVRVRQAENLAEKNSL